MLNAYLSAGMGDLIGLALGGTALVFFCCSAYVLTTRKDMSFLGGMLMAGVVVVLIGMVANIFLQLPAASGHQRGVYPDFFRRNPV
jgi:modulator of FtsH protease